MREEKTTYIDLTLGIVIENNKILLGMKKRGFGVGKWNGFGGKLLAGEQIEDSLIREFKEECGIVVSINKKIGQMDFHIKGDQIVKRVHIFMCILVKGKPQETEEMRPEWFDLNVIPYENMWSSDAIWYPYMLLGKSFKGDLWFESDQRSIENYSIVEESYSK